MEKLTFNSKEEIFEYLINEYLSVDLIKHGCVAISDYDDSVLSEEVQARGYYYFEDESDIKNYAEDSMDLYVFDRDCEIIDWVKENSTELDELTTSAPVGMYRPDCIELINKIAEEHGWEWLHCKLQTIC